MGLGGDPKTAHGGTSVFGTDLTMDGIYEDSSSSYAESPAIDLQGYTAVRLQYYRWLTVEDGAYDKATIYANGAPMWTNLKSPTDADGPRSTTSTRSGASRTSTSPRRRRPARSSSASRLVADQGLNLGGWNVDDLCVVGVSKSVATPTCGNGVLDPGEACDDGNTLDGDGCSATCGIEVTGGDDAPAKGGGCCSTGTSPTGALALGGIVLGMLLRRRKR